MKRAKNGRRHGAHVKDRVVGVRLTRREFRELSRQAHSAGVRPSAFAGEVLRAAVPLSPVPLVADVAPTTARDAALEGVGA